MTESFKNHLVKWKRFPLSGNARSKPPNQYKRRRESRDDAERNMVVQKVGTDYGLADIECRFS